MQVKICILKIDKIFRDRFEHEGDRFELEVQWLSCT